MRARTLFLTVGVLVATLGLASCLSSGSNTSRGATTTTRAALASVSTNQAATLAKEACKTYDAAVDASNARPNAADTYPSYFVASGQATGAARLDQTNWQYLAAALVQVTTDITQINSLQTQKSSGSGLAALNQTLGLLAGHQAEVDVLCAALPGFTSHPAKLTTG